MTPDASPAVTKAADFLHAMAEELAVPNDAIVPAYEDVGEWILREAKLPDNVTPENSKLKDPEERQRIARVFDNGLTKPTGYVLPIQRWQASAGSPRWKSERWKLRRKHLFLVPGDSAAGYRLPLGSLPHLTASQFPYIEPADPTEPRGPLPDFKPKEAESPNSMSRISRHRRRARCATSNPPT